jgi:hypothetical protein
VFFLLLGSQKKIIYNFLFLKNMKNKKGNIVVIAIIIVIIVITTGVIISLVAKKIQTPTQQAVKIQPTTPNLQAKSEFESSRINYAYINNADGHIIYNGKDVGAAFNGPTQGMGLAGLTPVLDGNDLAFTDNNGHLIYNGQDLGEYTYASKEGGGNFWPPILSSGHIAFYRTINSKMHLIYDSKDQGVVSNPMLDGDNIVFTNSNNHIIYNGKDLDIGQNVEISNNHIAYVTSMDEKSHVIYDGKDLGLGSYAMLSGNSFGYVSNVNNADHIIFNGKDLGEGGYPCEMNEKHMACVRSMSDGNHIIYDGKDLGIGNYPHLDGDNIAYGDLGSNDFSMKYNEKNIGQGARIVMNAGNYAYEKSNGTDYSNTNVIYNGKDLGSCDPSSVQLLDNNLAYGITTTGDKSQTMFDGKIIDGTNLVMSKKK